MQFFANLTFIGASLVAAIGCAHIHEVEEGQAAANSGEGTQMNIGAKEVKEGDRLDVFLISCNRLPGSRNRLTTPCHNNKVGEAIVISIIGEHSAIIQPEGKLVLNNTMRVEKLKSEVEKK